MKPVDPTHAIGLSGWIRSPVQYPKSDGSHKAKDDDIAVKPTVVQSVKDSVDLGASQDCLRDRAGASLTESMPRHGSQAFSVLSIGKMSGGTVSVAPLNASPGSTVTIMAIPEEGKKIIDISVTGKDGETVQVTEKGNGRYAFIMPDSETIVDVSFGAGQENPKQQA